MRALGVAWANLADSTDVFTGDAHTAALPGTDRRVVAMPYDFSAATATVRRGVARRGENNAEALGDWLGYDQARISELSAAGVLIGDASG